MMKNRAIIALILLALVIFLANFTPLGLLMGRPLIHCYHYQSSDYGFSETEHPEKGRDLKYVEQLFAEYKAEKNDPSLTLHRTSERNPFAVYEWYDYLTHRRWSYDYEQPIDSDG